GEGSPPSATLRLIKTAVAKPIWPTWNSTRAATAVCSLPHAPRACPGRGVSCASRAGPTGVGGGLGRGVVVVDRDMSANCYPHPQPLPSRLRACPLPASINLINPGRPGLIGGGEPTECAAPSESKLLQRRVAARFASRSGTARIHPAGSVKWKTAPLGVLSVAHTLPPCASMIDRQIDSPIPMPAGLVVKKALNSWSRLVDPMP
ncbi:MAG: hypothetical protein QOI46_6121, partial [Alphaproteobacteria bacterium]|nr:hypothetical protein [Alphaproteobacteria bacterium]